MKENIPGYPGYHVTRDGKVYSCLIQGGFSLGYTYKEIGRKVRLSPKVVSRFIRLRNSLD